MSVVYSIDWDWFTGTAKGVNCDPDLCGWKCKVEEGINTLCGQRASYADPVNNWRSLSSSYDLFWDYAQIERGAPLYVAECHASVLNVLSEGDRVVDWDYHVDEYPGDRVNCGSWRLYAKARGVKLLNKYQPNLSDQQRADALFLCLSSPWTPAELDHDFFCFVKALSDAAHVKPLFIGHRARFLRRSFRGI